MIGAIRKWVVAQFVAIAYWVLARWAAGWAKPPSPDIAADATWWVEWAEHRFPSESGEYKWRQVFARLTKHFPYADRKELELAIERAVRKL